MSAGTHDIEARRRRLLVRSAELRLRLAEESQGLQTPFAVVDQARVGLQWLRRHPEWPLGAGALLLVLRPRRALRVVAGVWSGWRLYKRGQRMLASLG
jgi:YqjK-like protein